MIGEISGLLVSIKTGKENSCLLTFDVNPEDIQVINKLMERYLVGEVLYKISLTHGDDNNREANG